MTRVAILGATGYSALELLKILVRHPGVEISALTSRQEDHPHIAKVHPSLTGRLDMACEDLSPAEVAKRAECVFCCLPHGVTTEAVPQLLAGGARVIDLSADYRLDDAATYEKWYGQKHSDADRLAKAAGAVNAETRAVYGLPEFFAREIKPARLIANPGCYPTTTMLALGPLLAAGLIEPHGIIVDAKSGISGAGRTAKLAFHYPECNESVSAYNVGLHRHTPEIEQILGRLIGREVQAIFTPHLIPMDRGILATCYSVPTRAVTQAQLLDALRAFYEGKPFVQVVEHLPATKDTTGTNFCHVTARVVRDRVITVSVLDNLIKGAAGAAVQNFNWMYGHPEATAL